MTTQQNRARHTAAHARRTAQPPVNTAHGAGDATINDFIPVSRQRHRYASCGVPTQREVAGAAAAEFKENEPGSAAREQAQYHIQTPACVCLVCELGRVRVISCLEHLAPAHSEERSCLPFSKRGLTVKELRNRLKHSVDHGQPLPRACAHLFPGLVVPELVRLMRAECERRGATASVALLSKPAAQLDEEDCLLTLRWIIDELSQHLYDAKSGGKPKYLCKDAEGVDRASSAMLRVTRIAEQDGRLASADALLQHLEPLKRLSQQKERMLQLRSIDVDAACRYRGLVPGTLAWTLQHAFFTYLHSWMDSVLDAHVTGRDLPPMDFYPFRWPVLPRSLARPAAASADMQLLKSLDEVLLVRLLTRACGGEELPVLGFTNFAQAPDIMRNEHNHPTAGQEGRAASGPEHAPAAHAAVIRHHLRLYPALLHWPAALFAEDGWFGRTSVRSLQTHPNFGALFDTVISTLTDAVQREHNDHKGGDRAQATPPAGMPSVQTSREATGTDTGAPQPAMVPAAACMESLTPVPGLGPSPSPMPAASEQEALDLTVSHQRSLLEFAPDHRAHIPPDGDERLEDGGGADDPQPAQVVAQRVALGDVVTLLDGLYITDN